jgi:hypothetical protein
MRGNYGNFLFREVRCERVSLLVDFTTAATFEMSNFRHAENGQCSFSPVPSVRGMDMNFERTPEIHEDLRKRHPDARKLMTNSTGPG